MTELMWEGKYRDGKRVAPVRIALPFQTVETVNESAQDRGRTLDLFASGKPTEWRNRLIWGDKKYVLPSLLPEFAGKVNLVYIDPPFNTDADFSFTTEIPETQTKIEKEPSIIEQKAYRDTWGKGLDSYLQWFHETATLLRELLAEDGSAYVHLDYHVSHYAKAVLDEVFGANRFQNEIVWKRTSGHSDSGGYGSVHDVILYYVKSEKWTWNQLFTPYDDDYVEQYYRYRDPDGRRWMSDNLSAAGLSGGGYEYSWKGVTRVWRCPKTTMEQLDKDGKVFYTKNGIARYKRYLDEAKGMPAQDLWVDIEPIRSWHKEKSGYPTQKSEGLLERILKASSNEGDLVLDCFCGSGTTAVAAEKLNRRWITCDLGRFAIHTTRKRLLGVANVKPFVVQNLGKYERQAWMAAEFEKPDDRAATEERYRRFILELFRAEPLTGHSWIHGIKGARMVHVGPVDAPITIADVKAIARDAWRAAGASKNEGTTAAVDILGWEFAFELNERAKETAAEARVDVKFRAIPRDVLDKKAIEQGDVQAKDFFELRALSTKLGVKRRTATLALTDFMLDAGDLPEDVARAVKHWSQWIDYWAVDWDYKDDTFHNQWQTYRTKASPELELETKHEYREPGSYRVVVKVIDLLGNDTTKMLTVEVK